VLYVGTSGWQYASWRGPFYPPGLPQRAWLGYYTERFATVEVNNAFYRLPERDTFVNWREQIPDDVVVAVKVSRYLTHVKRLREPAEPVARFSSRAEGLGTQLGPVLLQLPPTLVADAGLLGAVLGEFPAAARVSVEPRHDSWWTPEIETVLRRHHACLSWADRLGRPVTPLWRTGDFGYLRLHEGTATPWPRYGRRALDSWLDRIGSAFDTRSTDVFAYFNNDPGGAAIADAEEFAQRASRLGLHVARAGAEPSRQSGSASRSRSV
jgi:uncharacterized protein YecE (DUF72 family)